MGAGVAGGSVRQPRRGGAGSVGRRFLRGGRSVGVQLAGDTAGAFFNNTAGGDNAEEVRPIFDSNDAADAAVWRALRARGVFLGRDRPAKVAFLYTGQGSQYVNMLKTLREREPVVAETFAEADRVMTPLLGRPLTEFVFIDESDAEAVARLDRVGATRRPAPTVLQAELGLHDEARAGLGVLGAPGLAAGPRGPAGWGRAAGLARPRRRLRRPPPGRARRRAPPGAPGPRPGPGGPTGPATGSGAGAHPPDGR